MLLINKIILFVLIFSAPVYAQDATDYIVDTSKESIVTLNDNLRRTSRRIRQLEGGIALDTGTTGILSVERGGTGQDFSEASSDSLLYFGSQGVLTTSDSSGGDSELYLNGGFTFSDPQGKSNVIFHFPSNIDENPTTYGKGTITTLTGAVTYEYSGAYQVYAVNDAVTTYSTVARTKFRKLSTVSTLSGTMMLWVKNSAGGRSGTARVRVDGSLTGDTSSVSSVTPTSVSWSIDVSSLTDDQEYDIEIMLKDDATGANNTTVYLAEIVGYGS